jgi:hypothetical protein
MRRSNVLSLPVQLVFPVGQGSVYFGRKPFGRQTGKPYWRGRLSTVSLLVLTSLDQLRLIMKTIFTFYKTINEEVMCTEPAPSVSVPCC